MLRSRRLLAVLVLCGAPDVSRSQDSALAAALTRARQTFDLRSDGTLTGDGARLLIEGGRAAQFFLLGEEHGVAEIPKLAAALFRALAPTGYRHLAIETGDALASRLNALVLEADPEAAVKRFSETYWPGVPFYTLREEAGLLAAAVSAAGRRPDVLWGLDYDIVGDRYALRRLRDIAPNARARAAADRVIALADSMLDAALEAENPSAIFMFASPDTALESLRTAYAPASGSEAEHILALLETTLRINRDFAEGRNYESNVARAENLKRQFLRHYLPAARSGRPPRVMLKFGTNHVLRGRNFTNTFDLGTLAYELAEVHGGTAFNVMVVPGRGARVAQFDPRTFGYSPAPVQFGTGHWARPLLDLADSVRWTVYDLRALRPVLHAGRVGSVPPQLAQVIFGFDAFVVLAGSGPAESLVKARPTRNER